MLQQQPFKINPEYSLERLMLKLKFQYFGHLMWTADSLEKSLMLEKVEGRRKRGNQRMRQLDVINNVMDMMVRDREAWVCCSPWDSKELDTTGQLNNNKAILSNNYHFWPNSRQIAIHLLIFQSVLSLFPKDWVFWTLQPSYLTS